MTYIIQKDKVYLKSLLFAAQKTGYFNSRILDPK